MFCPCCNAYVTERSLIKTNVKRWENADIEYDAQCPVCGELMGKVSWGKLMVRKDLLAQDDEQPCLCPHCGGELPKDLGALPRKEKALSL